MIKKDVMKKEVLKSSANLLGSWSFLVGVVLAVLMGLGLNITVKYHAQLLWAVFLIGIVVGLLNVTAREVSAFLTSGTILALVSFLGVQEGVFDTVAPMIANVLKAILTLFIPATIIVALKAVFVLARR